MCSSYTFIYFYTANHNQLMCCWCVFYWVNKGTWKCIWLFFLSFFFTQHEVNLIIIVIHFFLFTDLKVVCELSDNDCMLSLNFVVWNIRLLLKVKVQKLKTLYNNIIQYKKKIKEIIPRSLYLYYFSFYMDITLLPSRFWRDSPSRPFTEINKKSTL